MGYKIKEFREKIGMTQVDLAKKSGVSRTTIVGLESGDNCVTTTKTLQKLADALNTTVEELFFRESV